MISPIVQVFVSVTSQISPSLMVERSASREKQIAVMLSENRHMFSQKDVDLLRMSEERVLRAQKLIPVAKSSVKVFTATRKYHNRVQEYYLEVQRVSTTARRRKLMRLDVPVHGGAGLAVLGQQLQGGEESEDDDDDSGDDDDPETPPPGLLKLKFEDVEVEAGTGASLELHYGDGHSIALLLNILPSGEVGYQTHPRTYSGRHALVRSLASTCAPH
ncbi:hypothetical protein C8Q80DRAFT_874559 [Daedaleopsis nitida]|nr:hypothetical protein C8Q80DRAFT_874559 [Daedaleopsis nitida]